MATTSKRIRIIATLVVLAVVAILVIVFAYNYETGPITPQGTGTSQTRPTSKEEGTHKKPSKVTSALSDSTHVIHGTVVQPNGEPMSNATVRIINPGSTEPREVQTNTSGAFRVEALPLDFYAVEATQVGFGPAVVIGVVPGGAALRLILQTGREIDGELLRRGKAVSGGVVHIGGPGMFPQRSQPAERNGRFLIGGLQLGAYEVIAVAPGLSSGFVDHIHIDSDEEDAETGEDDSVQLEMLTAPTVTLRFRGRRGLPDIETGVVTIAPRPIHVLALNALIHDGEATIDFLPPGEYWIRVRAPGFMPHEGRFWVTKEGGELDIVLKRGATIDGEVVDQANNPIAGARLRAVVETESEGSYDLSKGVFERFHRLARPDGTPFWWPTSRYTTDRHGHFEISGIPEGKVTLIAQKSEYSVAMSRPLNVQHDERYHGIRIELENGRPLRGRVEDQKGGALSGASVSIAPSALPAWLAGRSILTDRSGAFVFQDLPKEVQITVRHPDYDIVTQTLALSPSGKDDLVIKMDAPSLRQYTGRVLRTQRGPAKGARVWFMSGTSRVPVCSAMSDNKGQFKAVSCTTKPDSVIIYLDGYAPLIKELVNPDNPEDWVLRAGGELDVVSQRQPMHVRVEPDFYLPSHAAQNTSIDLDRWERHTIQRLAPGTYNVVCSTEGYAPARTEVTVVSGQRADAVCPHPQRIAQQNLIVVDKMGAPVDGAEVWFDDPKTSQRKSTDGKGRVSLEGDPGRWVTATASHADWGQGETVFQLSSDESEALPIRLEYPIGGKDQATFIEMLDDWGLDVVKDNFSLIINSARSSSPANNIGFRRGDKLLWARKVGRARLSVGVQRRHHVVVFELVQGAL